MSHHYFEDSGPYPPAKPARAAKADAIEAAVIRAREEIEQEVLRLLARKLQAQINSLGAQRDGSNMQDVYIAAKAFTQQYEALSK